MERWPSPLTSSRPSSFPPLLRETGGEGPSLPRPLMLPPSLLAAAPRHLSQFGCSLHKTAHTTSTPPRTRLSFDPSPPLLISFDRLFTPLTHAQPQCWSLLPSPRFVWAVAPSVFKGNTPSLVYSIPSTPSHTAAAASQQGEADSWRQRQRRGAAPLPPLRSLRRAARALSPQKSQREARAPCCLVVGRGRRRRLSSRGGSGRALRRRQPAKRLLASGGLAVLL